VEVSEGTLPDLELAASIQHEIRTTLLVTTQVRLVAARSLPRSEYKSKLIDFSDAEAGGKP
jgi:phenylacetate-CoA ligase